MSAPRKLTLILMYDDGKTHRMRMSRKFFLFLTALLVLLPTLGGLGIWTGWETWTAWQSFDQQRGHMQRELNNWRMQAERLSNMMQLAGLQVPDAGSVPLASLVEVLESATANPEKSSLPAESKPAGLSTTSPDALKPLPETQIATGNATDPAMGPVTDQTTAEISAEQAAVTANPREDEENNLDLQVVRLENVISRVQTGRKLRITLDLYNAKPLAGQVGGRILISLIDPNGKILPIQHDEGTFRISRFKKVAMQATLPDSVTAADNAALLITVIVDDEPVLRKIYQVESR